MSEVPSVGAPGSLIFVVVALKRFLVTLYQPKLGLAYPQKSIYKKKILKFLEDVFLLFVQCRGVCAHKKFPIAPQIFFLPM